MPVKSDNEMFSLYMLEMTVIPRKASDPFPVPFLMEKIREGD
jgi:hypothetical protein